MKIALYGYGKMGKTIERLAEERGHEIVLKINSDNASSIDARALKVADVAIEFSHPELAESHIKNCITAQVPVVIGTTGWYDQYEQLKKECIANNSAFLTATNFSVGVNLFFALNKHLAKLMQPHNEYKVAIEEIHHTEKLDAPSGTAITIAEGIIENYPTLTDWNLDEEVENKLTIAAKRIPNVPGTHEVKYQSTIDEIAIKHTAHSRDGFALGAILAAEFITNKHGVFTMNDVLKI
jgi:4-hydroxy-tetrahydrodipicolinate reductase